MVWYNPKTWFLNEEIKSFKNKDNQLTNKQLDKQSGEGIEDLSISGYGVSGLSSFNQFYSQYINKKHENEVSKIFNYRNMTNNPEISDVVEDAVNESLQSDSEGYVINFKISDESVTNKENAMKNINNEFYDLFYNKINIEYKIWDLFYTYYVDGRVFTENVINEANQKQGLIDLKKLPSETMDVVYNKYGKIDFYVQYLKKNFKKPRDFEEAKKDENIIVFYPAQINYIPYQFGRTKDTVYGYLEKCTIPYNQLKLLETSIIIYRIVRAPERFVFKIDTGSMPRDKAMKYVEKVKQKMNKKQTFDPQTGTLQNNSSVLCIRKNTEIKLLDGRNLPLTEVINEYNSGKENWVYTVNEDTHKIEPGKIVNAKITRLNEKLLRVHLDDGSYVDTTYDHKFIMRDGSKKRADELQENDSLMPLYTKHDKIHSKSFTDYEYVYDLKTNRWMATHKMVYENTQRDREKNEVVCHADFNRFNNDFSNLELWDNVKHNHKVTKVEFLEETDDTGCITVKGNHNFAVSFNGKSLIFLKNSIQDNFFLPSSDTRGSDISTIGGSNIGFKDLDDIYYFQRKLYRSLKYPLSRVENRNEAQTGDNLFRGSTIGEISRDEIKWAKFLERQQKKFTDMLKNIFLLHLDYKGLKTQYGLNRDNIQIMFNPPSDYKSQMQQNLLETQMNNYTNLVNEEGISKYFLMKKMLEWDEEQIKENVEGLKKDKELGLTSEEGSRW